MMSNDFRSENGFDENWWMSLRRPVTPYNEAFFLSFCPVPYFIGYSIKSFSPSVKLTFCNYDRLPAGYFIRPVGCSLSYCHEVEYSCQRSSNTTLMVRLVHTQGYSFRIYLCEVLKYVLWLLFLPPSPCHSWLSCQFGFLNDHVCIIITYRGNLAYTRASSNSISNPT